MEWPGTIYVKYAALPWAGAQRPVGAGLSFLDISSAAFLVPKSASC